MSEVHKYIERREVPLCDFCCRRDAEWTFPSDKRMDMTVPYKGQMVELRDSDAWGACNDCAELVEAGDILKLSEHVASILPSGGLPKPLHTMALIMMYSDLVPNLRPKIPAVRLAGGHITKAQGSKEFIEDVKQWRDELDTLREPLRREDE